MELTGIFLDKDQKRALKRLEQRVEDDETPEQDEPESGGGVAAFLQGIGMMRLNGTITGTEGEIGRVKAEIVETRQVFPHHVKRFLSEPNAENLAAIHEQCASYKQQCEQQENLENTLALLNSIREDLN